MLIVRGVNVFPSAVREVVSSFGREVSGRVLVRPSTAGVKQEPPLPVAIELAGGETADPALADGDPRPAEGRTGRADGGRARAVGQLATKRLQVQTRGPVTRKLQSQGVHHITLVGAGRQTSIDFWEGVLGMPFVFEQPNLDNAAESHLYFDPGRRPADHRVHERGARA